MNYKRDRLDRKRKTRLMTKAQKAGALDRIEEIFRQASWARRFGLTAKLRATALKRIRSQGGKE